MPPKTTLRDFLHKDILRSRVSTAPLGGRSHPSLKTASNTIPEEPHELDYLFDENSAESRGGIPESGTDSLFGEPIVKEKTTEEERPEKLQRFLSESIQAKSLSRSIIYAETPALKAMRKELENLVIREGEATSEENLEIRKQKRILIPKIAALEAAEKHKKAKGLKSTRDEIFRTLPAIGPEEARNLNIMAKKISKTVPCLEFRQRNPLKRNRHNIDNDLDGEERLRMGKNYKRPAAKVTGHWRTTLHDYFPDVEGKGSNIDRNTLTPEQKLLNRKELAKLGEALAQAERRTKLLEMEE